MVAGFGVIGYRTHALTHAHTHGVVTDSQNYRIAGIRGQIARYDPKVLRFDQKRLKGEN
jgi:hypothetical protein